jgi:hypothetical protein
MSKHTLKLGISEKGCLCVYGLTSRFPVSLYPEQWDSLVEFMPTIVKALADNRANLDKLSAISKAKRDAERALTQTTSKGGVKFIGAIA